MDNSESARKPAKGRGIDPNSARRVREERAVQIRKEKRFDRANIERRKVSEFLELWFLDALLSVCTLLSFLPENS